MTQENPIRKCRTTTVGQAEAAGYTHVEAQCCSIVAMPLRKIRMNRRLSPDTTLEQLAARLRCEKCGNPPISGTVAFWRQSDAKGYVQRPYG